MLNDLISDSLTEKDASTIADIIVNRSDEILSKILELSQHGFAKEKKNEEETAKVKAVKSRLDSMLRTLELADSSAVGRDGAQRAVTRLLETEKGLSVYSNNETIAEAVGMCFELALKIEEKHNLPYSAHRRYAELLAAQSRASEEIAVEERIIAKLEMDTSPQSFEVACAYGKLADKCLNVHFPEKTLEYLEKASSCWLVLAKEPLNDEQILALESFFDLSSQFFAFDAKQFAMASTEYVSDGGTPYTYMVSFLLNEIFHVAAHLVKAGRLWIQFDELGFSCLSEMLNRSRPFEYQMEQVFEIMNERAVMTGGIPLIDNAEFCGLVGFALLAGLLKRGIDVPLGHITATCNTLVIIADWQGRDDLPEKLSQEITSYIETQPDSKEKCHRLSIAYHNFGNFFREKKNYAAAELYFLYSVDEEKKKVEEYDSNHRQPLAMAYHTLANLFIEERKYEEAIEQLEQAILVFAALAKTDTDPAVFYKMYIECLRMLVQARRYQWIKETADSGHFTLSEASVSRIFDALNKAQELSAKMYEIMPDEYGLGWVKVCIESRSIMSWLDSLMAEHTRCDEFLMQAIEICENLLSRKSEVYYNAFGFVINYMESCLEQGEKNLDYANSAYTETRKTSEKVFSNIVSHVEETIKKDKISPKFLFPPELREEPTGIMLATNMPRWFFEMAYSFRTIYERSLENLCGLYFKEQDFDSVSKVLDGARSYIESQRGEMGFFMTDIVLRNITQMGVKHGGGSDGS